MFAYILIFHGYFATKKLAEKNTLQLTGVYPFLPDLAVKSCIPDIINHLHINQSMLEPCLLSTTRTAKSLAVSKEVNGCRSCVFQRCVGTILQLTTYPGLS